MQQNLSSENYRHPRRSACDHCRAYKLRCESDSRLGTSCNRCLKTSLVCTTTTNHSLQRRTVGAAQEQSTAGSKDGGKTTGNTTNKQVRPKEPRMAATRTLSAQISLTTLPQQQQQHNRVPTTPLSIPRTEGETQLQNQLAAGKHFACGSLQNQLAETT